MTSPLEILSGTLGFVLAVFLVALSIYWLLFPLLVYSKLNRIAKSLAALEKEAESHALVQRNFMMDAREWMKQTTSERMP